MPASHWRVSALAVIISVGAALLAACGDSTTAVVHVTKTSATFAEQPTVIPNYILPLASSQFFSAANVFQFQYLMYRPLYSFGSNGQVLLNDSLSLADPPVYASGGKSVTITLKGWKWSDGTQITGRDIQFWQNLVSANKAYWPAYVPGEYPDNVVGSTIDPAHPLQITFALSQPFGSYFFTYNELSQITPLPQHIWDRTSATGPVGNFDQTSAGASAVYRFLDSQSRSVSTYNTDPLWKVVSGPWRLKSMDTAGNVTLVPNPGYGGPVKPTLKEFIEVPFAQQTDEVGRLRSASSVASTTVDFGYIPTSDAAEKTSLSHVYTFNPWKTWSINYIAENFTNPVSGPVFSQLYFRQAMQHLIDQRGMIQKAFLGYANPTFGPVPTEPPSAFLDAFERGNPYPFSPTDAVSLLQNHGWTVRPGGVSTCAKAGTGAGECGAGVKQGQAASFKLEYVSGTPTATLEMQLLAPDFALAGIQITLTQAPLNTILGAATPCAPGATCTWDMEYWDTAWIYAPDHFPSGDQLWACTGSGAAAVYAGSDVGGYCDPQAEADIVATETGSALQAMYAYEDFMAKNLPVIWFPVQDYELAEINKALKGAAPLDPLLQIYPETWHWS